MSDIKEFEVGATIGGYTVDRKERLENLHGLYYELTHPRTGARHLHLAVPDDNNAFGVVFPTVPKSGNGVPHILEHVSLMGSKKFPVKDPFFSMIPRSLQTFMNASTADDATTFLFSTRNEKDYYNLMSVYLDAPFFPLLRELSFKQDGHRLEFEVPDDPDSGLRFKGVVFNEMKGYMATPLWTSYQAIGTALYPELTYEVNAGGDPDLIPDLSYEELKEFHSTHYHPSNSFFITYGNLPLDVALNKIEEEVLANFEKITPDVEISEVKRWTSPREYKVTYPLAPNEDVSGKSLVSIGWVTTPTSNSYEMLTLKVLQEVLVGNAASPLRKALIDSGLGDGLVDILGLQTQYKEAGFVVGLKGANSQDAKTIEQLVLDTLDGVVKEGVDAKQVDAAIHQLEIKAREISDRPYPFGIRMIYELGGPFVYGGDPYAILQFDTDVAKLQEARKGASFFEDQIRRWFIDNPHRALIVTEPDQELEEARNKQERDRLAAIEASLTDDQKKQIVEEARVLKELQEKKPDITVLPTLELSDIPMTLEDVPHEISEIGGARVGFFPQPTNGITYIDVQADFSGLDERLKERLGLFAYVLPKSGAGGDDYLTMASRIDAYTGGINAGAGTRPIAGETGDFRQVLTLTGKALARNHNEFVAILRDFLSGATFEPKRVRELIAEYKGQYDSFVVLAGTQFAVSSAHSQLSSDKAIEEKLGGLTQYALLKNLAQLGESELDEVISDLNAIRDHLFRSGGLNICVTSDDQFFPELRKLLEDTVSSLPSGGVVKAAIPAPVGKITHLAKTVAVPVSYNAYAFKAPEFTSPDAPALHVLATYLSSKYFIRELREKRGAYGAGSMFSREGGFFTFVTSQDPQLAGTFEIFRAGVKDVIDNGISDVDLKEAVLSACRAVDPLMSPDVKGRSRFFGDLAGYTLDLQAQYKKRLLEVREGDLKRVAQAHLSGDNGAMATVTSPDKAAEANEQMGGLFEITAI